MNQTQCWITWIHQFLKEFVARFGAGTIFATFCDVMSTERMSEERKKLSRIRAMIVIYMLMYGESQRAHLFQVASSITLQ